MLLFFVLSGVVLTLPALRPGFSWLAYYPRRVIRLYLPVFAAVALTALLVAAVPRVGSSEFSTWTSNHPASYTLPALVRDLTLVRGSSGTITPLWSLQWEVIFSILLPAFVLLAWAARRRWLALAVVPALIAVARLTGSPYVHYMSIFAIGAAIAALWPQMAAVATRLAATRAKHGVWITVVGVGALLTVWHWIDLSPGRADVTPWPDNLTIAGVTLLVIAAGFYPHLVTALSSTVAQWLGKVSFSLYLVHEPILIAARYALPTVHTGAVILVAIPLSLGVAAFFTRWVEVPSHRLARSVGARVAEFRPLQRSAPATAPVSASES